MKSLLMLLLWVSSSLCLSDSSYCVYWADDSLMGYKNADSVVVITPKQMSATGAQSFVNVTPIVIMEEDRYRHYYLRRNGTIFGRDSVFFFDNAGDTESEGYIRFRERENDLMGMFSHDGKIVIPAEYNALSHVRNSLCVGLTGATKVNEDHSHGCNHYRLEGGRKVLLNMTNEIVVDSFTNDDYLNYHSLETVSAPSSDPIRRSYRSRDGEFYSFIDYKKEFTLWLTETFLKKNCTEEFLKAHTFDSLSCSSKNRRSVEKNTSFIESNFTVIMQNLREFQRDSSNNFISVGSASPYSALNLQRYVEPDYRRDRYPLFRVIINRKKGELEYQNGFEFLRTEKGYRLTDVVLRGEGEMLFSDKTLEQ